RCTCAQWGPDYLQAARDPSFPLPPTFWRLSGIAVAPVLGIMWLGRRPAGKGLPSPLAPTSQFLSFGICRPVDPLSGAGFEPGARRPRCANSPSKAPLIAHPSAELPAFADREVVMSNDPVPPARKLNLAYRGGSHQRER